MYETTNLHLANFVFDHVRSCAAARVAFACVRRVFLLSQCTEKCGRLRPARPNRSREQLPNVCCGHGERGGVSEAKRRRICSHLLVVAEQQSATPRASHCPSRQRRCCSHVGAVHVSHASGNRARRHLRDELQHDRLFPHTISNVSHHQRRADPPEPERAISNRRFGTDLSKR